MQSMFLNNLSFCQANFYHLLDRMTSVYEEKFFALALHVLAYDLALFYAQRILYKQLKQKSQAFSSKVKVNILNCEIPAFSLQPDRLHPLDELLFGHERSN